MADEAKRTGKDPVYDTDRAWERFKQTAAREPVPAYWRHADEAMRTDASRIETRIVGISDNREKEGAIEMNLRETNATPGSGMSPAIGTTPADGAGSAWRTERPRRRRLRRLTAGAAAAVMAIGLFTTPLGDHVFAAMQQTFRIQQVAGVGITADDLTAIASLLENGSPEGDREFNLAQYGTLNQSAGGASSTVTWEEAEERMGSLLQLDNAAAPYFQPATTLTFHLNVKAVNRLLTRLGCGTTLPAEADGNAIQLHIPDGVTASGTLAGKPARLLQFGKPEQTVDGGIDAAVVRDAVLGLPVLPDSLRTKLAAIGDWQHTLPVPARDGVTTDLKIGGHDAVMTLGGDNRYLLWLDGDRMNLLSVDAKDFPTESDFKQAAEELIRP